ncbi:MAG: hypothetical protein ACI9DJ_001620 [Algoriphagus sp.]|jgi:hypothetical protein
MISFSFDSHPFIYQLIGHLMKVAFLGLLLWQFVKKQKSYNYVHFVLLTLILFWFKLPIMVYNNPINLDESMFVVGAMKLADYPLYWKYVDGNTSGPFSFYFVTAFFEFFSLEYDYINLRVLEFVTLTGFLLFMFLGLKKLFNPEVAFIGILPATFFLAQTQRPDFVHYSGERFPMLLLSLSFFLFAKFYSDKNHKTRNAIILGLILGTTPFSKLQVAPIALCFVPFVCYLLLNENKVKATLLFLFSGIVVPAALSLIMWQANYFDEAFKAYFLNNLGYGVPDTWYYHLWIDFSKNQNPFLFLAIFLSLFWIFIRKKTGIDKILVWLVKTMIVVNIYCIYKPGATFDHYFLFLIFPLALLFTINLFALQSYLSNKKGKLLISTILVISCFGITGFPFGNIYPTTYLEKPIDLSPVGKEVLKYASSNDQLVVWGEAGKLYLETKMLQGSKWSFTYWGMYDEKIKSEFKEDFLSEIKDGRIPVIVDANKPGNQFINRGNNGIETFPELYKYTQENYTMTADIEGMRVFVRNDRTLRKDDKTLSLYP